MRCCKLMVAVLVAGLSLAVAGCSPEASTPAKSSGTAGAGAGSSKPREQAGSTTGETEKKGGAEVPEPAPTEEK